MVRVFIVQRVVGNSGNVDGGPVFRRHFGNSEQRKEPAVTESPYANAIAVYIGQRFQIARGHTSIREILATDVHVDALPPLAAITDTAAVIGCDHHISVLEEILMDAVIDRIVPLNVPAVVILIDAVAMDPDDGRMFF